MKKALNLIVVIFFVVAGFQANAQTYKFGHIDSQKLLQSLPESTQAQAALEAEGKSIQEQIEIMQPLLQLILAAENGDDESQLQLALFYFTGKDGIKKNLVKSFEWSEKSAKQGNTQAQLLVGGFYLDGEAVELNVVMAYAWVSIAAENKIKIPASLRRKLAEKLTHNKIDKGKIIADELKSNIIDSSF